MLIQPKPINAFIAGVMCQVGVSMAFQDWLGLERYIEVVRVNWVDLHWLMGASIAACSIYAFCHIESNFLKAKKAIIMIMADHARLTGREI